MNHCNSKQGAIAWMARNPVAANLAMALLIIGGILVGFTIKQEVFPEFDTDIITVTVPYPGASPAEVERSIVLALEEAVRGLDGVKRIQSFSYEGSARVIIELLTGSNANKALQDIKNSIDRITSFPEDAERPIVSLVVSRREVITVVIYGQQPESTRRLIAEEVRENLLTMPSITYTELSGVRPFEISIEVPQASLRAYSLTLGDIAREIAGTAVEIPGGAIKTSAGEVLLRTKERRDLGREFANVPLLCTADGSQVLLGDIAKITDGFEDTDESASYNGEPAAIIKVYRVGDQTPIEVARETKKMVSSISSRLPRGIFIDFRRDWSEIYRDRIKLLLKNALFGLVLVLFILGLFLEIRLAFWVTMGIPTSIIGALLLMPSFGVSINMISLFAFILTIGIVVDDAVVVGENIYEARQKAKEYIDAAIDGTHQVAVPVTFSVLTNIVAFLPLFFVEGISGKLFRNMPSIIIPVFAISLLECLFILPAHLGHQKPRSPGLLFHLLEMLQTQVSKLLKWFIEKIYTPVQLMCLRHRYLTVSAGLAILILTVGLVAGKRITFSFLPKIEGDLSLATVTLPYGVPVETTQNIVKRLTNAAYEVAEDFGGKKYLRGVLSRIGADSPRAGPVQLNLKNSSSNQGYVQVELVTCDKREFTAAQFTEKWRRRIGTIPGVENLAFKYNIGPSAGAPIDVELSHTDVPTLEKAASKLADTLRSYQGVKDIDDGFSRGKPQITFKIKPAARSLGIRAVDLGRQIRNAFYGAEALRQQRGRNEIKVMVRLPESERTREYSLEELMIRTKNGGEIPLVEAARLKRDYAYTHIKRADGRRTMNVTADIVEGAISSGDILDDLKRIHLPDLMKQYPGLTYSFEGEQRAQRESLGSLTNGFVFVLLIIYAMLAIPFKSYIQPFAIMVSIPFGIVGAILGHMVMGYELNIISLMGIVALSGVVVNDSLILIDAANQFGRQGMTAFEALSAAGKRRFRPILLTSLTTFFGLMPMIFETSVQARFLVPMAISLGYGILFATFITLLLIPSLCLIIDDLQKAARSLTSFFRHPAPAGQ